MRRQRPDHYSNRITAQNRVLEFINVRNSSRVFCCVRKQPSMHEVVVIAPGFCTPRIVIHKCLKYNVSAVSTARHDADETRNRTHVASMTTATPRGLIASSTAIAICFVRRSWTCSLREKVSAMRASLESPNTSFLGMYAMVTCRQVLGTCRQWKEGALEIARRDDRRSASRHNRERRRSGGRRDIPCQ